MSLQLITLFAAVISMIPLSRSITIVTFNVHEGLADIEKRGQIVNYLTSSEAHFPDLYVLAEVTRDDDLLRTTVGLDRALGSAAGTYVYHFLFEKLPDQNYGIGIIYNSEILQPVSTEIVQTTSSIEQNSRNIKCVFSIISTREHISVYGVHLKAYQSSTNQDIRHRQIHGIMKDIFDHRTTDANWIIAGDINEGPTGTIVPFILRGQIYEEQSQPTSRYERVIRIPEAMTGELITHHGFDYIIASKTFERQNTFDFAPPKQTIPSYGDPNHRAVAADIRTAGEVAAAQETSTGTAPVTGQVPAATATASSTQNHNTAATGTGQATAATNTVPVATSSTPNQNTAVSSGFTMNPEAAPFLPSSSQSKARQPWLNYYDNFDNYGKLNYYRNQHDVKQEDQLSPDYNGSNKYFNSALLAMISIMILSCLGCGCICISIICWSFGYFTAVTVHQHESPNDDKYHHQICLEESSSI